MTIRALAPIKRTNWKQLVLRTKALIKDFDAQALVIGWPLNLNGTEGRAAQELRRIAHNLARSLGVPVFLQDERLTSRAAEEELRAAGQTIEDLKYYVDSRAAAIILRDFITSAEKDRVSL